MKINKKGISVLLASMLISGMLVGCNDNSNTDTTKTLTKRVEVTKDKTETKEATEDKTKDKEEKAPKDDKESSSKKQVNTKKDNTNTTTKEEPSNKHKCWLCKKNITNENFGGYSEDGTMICYKCLNKYGKDEPEEPKEDDEKNECSICGGHVGVKEMCKCDGTIHHRTCHVDAYTCPSCNRYGLKHDPDIYGCPYCGYPVEDYDDYDDDESIEEPSDTYEIENYNEEEE